MNRTLERVNVASLRLALIGTGLVAVIYAIVAVVIVVVVTNILTAQVDSRLQSSLLYYQDHRPTVTTSGVGEVGRGASTRPP